MNDTLKINNPDRRFEFVAVASARAHQLLRGCLPKMEGSEQPARRAQQEVASGAVARIDHLMDAGADADAEAPAATDE